MRFSESHSTQHALMPLYKKWFNNIDPGHMFEALLTGLSIAFDCLQQHIYILISYMYISLL